MNTTAFAALVKKDMQLFFTDKRSLIMGFVAPIVIASFFGFVFDNSAQGKKSRIPIAVVDLDGSTTSKAVAAKLGKEEAVALEMLSLETARKQVQEGDLRVAVVFPKGFGDQAGRAFFGNAAKPQLTFLFDPSHGVEKEMIRGILTGEIMEVAGKEMFGGAGGVKLAKEALTRLNDDVEMSKPRRRALKQLLEGVENFNTQLQEGESTPGPALSTPFTLKEEPVTAGNAEWNSFASSFTGMGVQFILFMGIEAGVSVLVQRQRGLWKRLRAAPISKGVLLGSRAVSAAISALLILTVLFTFARFVFGVRIEGSIPGFILVGISFSLMTATFGLLIASFGGTPEATRPLAVLATLVMVMLGGSWIPTFMFPAWLQKFALIVPTRWAVDGLNATSWRGLGFVHSLPYVGMLLAFAALFGFIAVKRFRWEGEPLGG